MIDIQSGWAVTEVGAIAAPGCRSVAFSPDGSALATVGGGRLTFFEYPDREVWTARCDPDPGDFARVVWGFGADRLYVLGEGRLTGYEAESGNQVELPERIGEFGALSAIALSADEQFLAIGTVIGRVVMLAERTGTTLVLRGTGPVTALGWRPGYSELCVARDSAGTLEFWDVPDQAMLASMQVPDSPVSQLAWSSDGRLLAAVTQSAVHKIRVGAPNDRVVTARWPVQAAAISPVAVQFSQDGSQLLIGVRDGAVTVTDRDLRSVGELPGDISSPWAFDVSADGLIAIRTGSDTVALWGLPGTTAARRRSADRRWAARHGRTVGRQAPDRPGYVRALARPEVLPITGTAPMAFAWWPDGRTVCVATSIGTLARVRLPAAQALWTWTCADGQITHATVSHQGLVAITHGEQITIVDSDGHPVGTVAGGGATAWAPSAAPEPLLAVAEPGPQPRQVLLYSVREFAREPVRLTMPDGVAGLGWSPDGRLLAAAGRGHVVLWDPHTRRRVADPLRVGSSDRLTGPLAWSPTGRRLAAVSRGRRSAAITTWNTRNWRQVGDLPCRVRPGWPPLAWSPDGRMFTVAAAAGDSDEAEVWDSVTQQRLMTLSRLNAGRIGALSWSPEGDALAVAHADGTVVIWDIADAAPSGTVGGGELPFDRDTMVKLACTAGAVGAAVPLSLLSGLLALLGGDPPEELGAFAEHRGVATLRGLRWAVGARVGLVAMLAADLPRAAAYVPPPGASSDDLAIALGRVLSGRSCSPSRVPLPAIELARLLGQVNERLVTFLELLGPVAVAAEPTLPARLRHLKDELTALSASQLRLLSIRVPMAGDGRSEGAVGGHGRAGVARHGQIDTLLLSQLALPPVAFAMRYSRDELLYRTRDGSLPPAPRAVVLVLDDTAAAHGEVGVTLRVIAHLLATTVVRKGRQCALVTLGEPAAHLVLSRPEDLFRIWTAGTDMPADPVAAVRLVDSLVSRLAVTASSEIRVVTLTHAFAPALPYRGAITVRVHYRGQPAVADDPLSIVLGPNPTAAELTNAVAQAIS